MNVFCKIDEIEVLLSGHGNQTIFLNGIVSLIDTDRIVTFYRY
jgi:hypothetical protein